MTRRHNSRNTRYKGTTYPETINLPNKTRKRRNQGQQKEIKIRIEKCDNCVRGWRMFSSNLY